METLRNTQVPKGISCAVKLFLNENQLSDSKYFMSNEYPAPDELRDDYINESTSFPGEDNSEPLANLDDPDWLENHDQEVLTRSIDPVSEPTDWYKKVATFEQLWKLAATGNQEANEELLVRQWEYNGQSGI